ncbi:hypothetical protein HBH61_079900 [Parastagonospora nodorum]|nr:hypothetical protein HBH61_079900 [Parastagonospora nodorum]KAH5078926.1 hypothetical protein HBH95_088280 [Parastagonospora nodorum]KAH5106058.1 hypothetical protein HBH72_061670 [Parastagonospora nodorum]KAH5259083.1 hypothetical protein HBI72_119330 [Parastagonospora nodorum]KAH5470649.1 hypothetical protein HBI28_157270 [Parastagonospora nodorum]
MPPKKLASSRPNDTSDAPTKFTWEGANDNKVPHLPVPPPLFSVLTSQQLLLLTQGRYVKTDEYEQLASAFTGTTVGSIRNRISALRVKQRNLYEEMGWDVPEGGAGHSAKKKRGAEGGDEGTPSKKPRGEQGEGTPAKKPRAKKGMAKAKAVEEESEEVAQSDDGEIKPENGIKKEMVDDEEV